MKALQIKLRVAIVIVQVHICLVADYVLHKNQRIASSPSSNSSPARVLPCEEQPSLTPFQRAYSIDALGCGGSTQSLTARRR